MALEADGQAFEQCDDGLLVSRIDAEAVACCGQAGQAVERVVLEGGGARGRDGR